MIESQHTYRITTPGKPDAVHVHAYALVAAVRSYFHIERRDRPVPGKLEPGQSVTITIERLKV